MVFPRWMQVWAWMLPFGLAWGVSAAAPTTESVLKLPPAATASVDFNKDVRPVLESACIKCHGRGKSKGGWRMDTRETALAPSDSGAAIIVGNSAQSRLIHLVAGTDPDDVMPQKGKKLTATEVGVLRAWIDQGVKWPADVQFGRIPPNNLVPRAVDLPRGSGHPLDRLLAAYQTREKLKSAKPVDDRTYVRRVFFDVVGVPPTDAEWERFEKDGAHRRERLVARLLEDRQRYAQHWLTFWNDLLRNDYTGTGYIDGGRKPLHRWLYAALRDNMRYDRFVRELVNPTPASEGFTKGIVWRGVVNASMTPPMQAAQNISQVLMGVNLKCASCHDSFIDDWQLSDCYGLAGIYADGPLPMVQCDKPTGKVAPMRFLFPELGSVDPNAARSNRLEQVARIITQPSNGRLSRTVVNRLWARLMGRGLVEPQDTMQNPAWDRDTLDWLAEDLVAHGWDLKRTLSLILTSRAYAMPTVDAVEKAGERYVFRGPSLRRLTAEQFRDTLGAISGEWFDKPEGDLGALLVEGSPSGTATGPEAFWIWGDPHGATGVPPGTNSLRRTIEARGTATEAVLYVHADNSVRVFLNGKRVRGLDAADWSQAGVYDLREGWRAGSNTVGIEAVNGGDGPNPAGVLAYLRLRETVSGKTSTNDLATDARWESMVGAPSKWDGDGNGWRPASVLGAEGMGPWNLAPGLAKRAQGTPVFGQVRAALVSSDRLLTALGRPNREQVTTVRASQATTLQALELTNGETLANLLRKGADRLAQRNPSGVALVESVFRRGLGRPPTRQERDLSLGLVGKVPQADAVEDFLWSMAMLPEFQFIR